MTSTSIGRVVSVHGFQVRVELHSDQRSAVRASLDGVDTHVKINAYLTFDLGAGESVLGIVTDLDAREVFEPGDSELTLELIRPRRTACVQLLGTLRVQRAKDNDEYQFDPGVNILPTLDTLAVPARREVLSAVLTDAPKRNESLDEVPPSCDGRLVIGTATAAPDKTVHGSFNDFFSRPLAVVGNTGSGKSCTIATLLQQANLSVPTGATGRPRFFILDINGEYSSAFSVQQPTGGRQPNKMYVNGIEFGVPIWLMNAREICQWLSAAEQVQEPTLKQFWSLAKGLQSDPASRNAMLLGLAERACDSIVEITGNFTVNARGQKFRNSIEAAQRAIEALQDAPYKQTLKDSVSNAAAVSATVVNTDWVTNADKEPDLLEAVAECREAISAVLGGQEQSLVESADKPIHVPLPILQDPKKLADAAKIEGMEANLGQMLRGLQLRLANRLSDKRWQCVRNYDQLGLASIATWFNSLGVGTQTRPSICVIDCSMLSAEVLPFVCAIIGRLLLDVREFVSADERFNDPWVLVLEEAHNYVRPRRQEEDRGIIVSRETFERIAKEGRKFGLSLIVASQRPSEISPTVLSQCANFVVHRLQNPEDIDHFRKIVPSQSRRLMEQITVLRAGEGIVVGSAFHIPSRVQVKRPIPEPSSKSSAPFTAWRPGAASFNLDAALGSWVPSPPPQADPSSNQTHEN